MAVRLVLAFLVLAASALSIGDSRAAPDAGGVAHRFPQPVRVGDLINRDVLEPVEAQPVLGHVRAIARSGDGELDVIINYGGFLGIGAHPIAVPVGATALLGEHVAVMDLSPAQLAALPPADLTRFTPLPPDETIRVGLVRPFH